MKIDKIAAFSDGDTGGNPAGVVLLDEPLSATEMADIAYQVGYSETAFAYPLDTNKRQWRVRYFSPESEVPFCGHASIALGAVLGKEHGEGCYALKLNEVNIEVTAATVNNQIMATLSSPPTKSRALTKSEYSAVMKLFSLTLSDLSEQISPAWIHGGSNHILIPLKSREHLAKMQYDLVDGKQVMDKLSLVTIMLIHIEDEHLFFARNAFASGGIYEDAATGAAAAALAGYLRDVKWPHGGNFVIKQGHDMGMPSVLNVSLSEVKGSPIQISGTIRAFN